MPIGTGHSKVKVISHFSLQMGNRTERGKVNISGSGRAEIGTLIF